MSSYLFSGSCSALLCNLTIFVMKNGTSNSLQCHNSFKPVLNIISINCYNFYESVLVNIALFMEITSLVKLSLEEFATVTKGGRAYSFPFSKLGLTLLIFSNKFLQTKITLFQSQSQKSWQKIFFEKWSHEKWQKIKMNNESPSNLVTAAIFVVLCNL